MVAKWCSSSKPAYRHTPTPASKPFSSFFQGATPQLPTTVMYGGVHVVPVATSFATLLPTAFTRLQESTSTRTCINLNWRCSLTITPSSMSWINTGVVIAGCVSDPAFHRCLKLAKALEVVGVAVDIDSDGEMHEPQYDEYLSKMETTLGGDIFNHKAKHLVLLDGGRKYLGGVEELISVAEEVVPYFDRAEDDKVNWVEIARTHCEKGLSSTNRPLVYMDVAQGTNGRARRLVFQLYREICPRTSENFRALCTGEKGNSARGEKLSFKGSPFHRVVRDGWVQGGDIISGAGDGGVSIYGDVFGDETFAVRFAETGVLAMANDGPHTNASQFLVALAPQPWLDHKVVGFGRVILGMAVMREMSEVETLNQRPVTEWKVTKCGELTPAEFAVIVCK